MRRPTWLQIILSSCLVALTLCLTAVAWAAHVSDVPPALQLSPIQLQTVEAKINLTRMSLGFAPRRVDTRLQSAAASCFTRSDTCQDATAYLSLLASHGYPMGAVHIALGFGRSEDEVLAQWLAEPYTAYTIYKTGGYSVYEDMGCKTEFLGAGVNVVCFVASEFRPMATTTPLPQPRMNTPSPLPSRTPTPSGQTIKRIEINAAAGRDVRLMADQLCRLLALRGGGRCLD